MAKFKIFLFLAVTTLLFIQAQSESERVEIGKVEKVNKRQDKRAVSALTTAIISAGITAGTSLTGTTVSALMDKTYSVAVSGSVENFSKWTMVLEYCRPSLGQINKPMVSIPPGKKEGFASHKTGHLVTGSYLYCRYKVAKTTRIHIMYTAPFNFNHHTNRMALAITTNKLQLNAAFMNHDRNKDLDYMDRQVYYEYVRPTKICGQGFCIKGVMGTSHHPVITIKLYPLEFGNLSPSVKKLVKDVPSAAEEYQALIEDEFN